MPNLNIRHLQLFFKQITKEAETPTKTGGTTKESCYRNSLFRLKPADPPPDAIARSGRRMSPCAANSPLRTPSSRNTSALLPEKVGRRQPNAPAPQIFRRSPHKVHRQSFRSSTPPPRSLHRKCSADIPERPDAGNGSQSKIACRSGKNPRPTLRFFISVFNSYFCKIIYIY